MEFFCYAYGRLSKEDLDKKTESDSIKNQRDLIHAYLTKPFHFAELEARIRVLLNRKFIQQSSCLTYGSLSLDTLSRTAGFDGVPIGLTAKECSILEYFLLNQGRLITQQELI